MPQRWNIKRICKTCNKEFYARANDVKNGRGIYCSWDCRAKGKRRRVIRICQKCKKSFQVLANEVEKGYGKFCSRACFLSSYRNPIKKCVDCNTVIDNRAKRCVRCSQKKFISPTLNKGHSLEVCKRLSNFRKNRYSPETTGDKHWNWKGGISDSRDKIQNSIPYKIWREKVFKRDNFTCQKCSKYQVYIEAHHIKSFAKYPKLRFMVNNGITLCKKCHREMHKKCLK